MWGGEAAAFTPPAETTHEWSVLLHGLRASEPGDLQTSYENGGMLFCVFQRLQRPGKSILKNVFKNKGFMKSRATLGRLQEPVNIRRTLFEGKGHAADPGIAPMSGLYL